MSLQKNVHNHNGSYLHTVTEYETRCSMIINVTADSIKKGHFQSTIHNSPASDISLRISQTRLQTQEFITVQPGK